MQRWLLALVLVISQHGLAHAQVDPGPGSDAGSDTGSDAAPPPILQLDHEPAAAPPPTTPVVLEPTFEPAREHYHPLRAELTLTGMYAGFIGWMYIAWYQHHKPLAQYKFGGDDKPCKESGLGRWFSECALTGWAGDQTYAGGEDKFGHAWSTMSLSRLGDEVLEQWGGVDHHKAMFLSTALAEALFIGVEVRDGFAFEFSYSDIGGDTVGALVALALMQWPRLDEMFDFRVQYFPSQMYLRKLDGSSPCPYGGCSRWNIAEDYSGQTYLLAFHLASIHSLREMQYGTLARFVDVAFGFDSRNYKPQPDADLAVAPKQQFFLGISLNAQGVFDYLLEDKSSPRAKTLRKVTHGLFEVFNLPFSSFALFGIDHYPCRGCLPQQGGA
jgi:hypothetical protein